MRSSDTMTDESNPPATPDVSPYTTTPEPARTLAEDLGLAREIRDELVRRAHDGDGRPPVLAVVADEFDVDRERLCTIASYHPAATDWFEFVGRRGDFEPEFRLRVTEAGHEAMRDDPSSLYPGETPDGHGRTVTGDEALWPDRGGQA